MKPRQQSIDARAGRGARVAGPLLVLAAVGFILTLSSTAWACPGCKEALASGDGSGGDLVSGFFWSILFMLSMPFLIFGTFCGSMYVVVRRARAAEAKAPQAATAQSSAAVNSAQHDARTAPAGSQSLAGA